MPLRLIKFCVSLLTGDRTKHLRNIHGIQNPSTSSAAATSGSGGIFSNGLSSIMGDETNSSISSLHSTSDASLASSIMESPLKHEPSDHQLLSFGDVDVDDVDPDTVTMSIDEVMQFAQPVSDFC